MARRGKRRKKKAQPLGSVARYFAWQTAMSVFGRLVGSDTRSRFAAVLRASGSDALDRAERLAQRRLESEPDHMETAIQYAEVAMARQQWGEASRRWKTVLDRHAPQATAEIYERIHLAYVKDGHAWEAGAVTQLNGALNLTYQQWCRKNDTLTSQDLERLAAAAAGWRDAPRISILLPCRDPSVDQLAATIGAVVAQVYPHWELCVADDTSADPRIRELLACHASADPRIKLALRDAPGGAAHAFNMALEAASGEFCCVLDQRDIPARHALLFLAGEIVRNPAIAWLYSDFDHVDAGGQRLDPVLRSGPDPDLCRSLPYMGTHATYRTDLLRQVGGMRDGFEPAENHDLALRMLERTPAEHIRHVPNILFHRRTGELLEGSRPGTGACGPASRAVKDHLARSGVSAEVSQLHASQGCRIRYPLPEPAPLVSIIIPTRDRLDLLHPCIESIRERTSYPNFELILIDNESMEPASLRYFEDLRSHAGVQVLREPQPFNWSRLNNLGAAAAKGSVLCLLNNDVEVLNESWLTELVAHAMRREVGVAGAALWYPNGRLQHGGVVFQPPTGHPMHAMMGVKRTDRPARARVTQGYSAVTGACMVMRKEVFVAAGGLDEAALPIGYSDVDLCLSVGANLGLRCIWTPFAELFHRESASRGRLATKAERARSQRDRRILLNRWYERMVDDPHYRATLTAQVPDYSDYPGARIGLNRHVRPRPLRLAFVHIPKTAGVTLRSKFLDTFPVPSTLAISARTLLRCYEGDAAATTELRRRLRDTLILFSHISYGFGDLVGWECAYATMLRSPVGRALSHYRHMFLAPHSPFVGTPLASAPLRTLLSKGAMPGNLMLRKILGEPPEEASWDVVNAGSPLGAAFAGFRSPAAAWRGQYDLLLAGPDVPPDQDMSKVDRAMEILERDFAFVGRVEELDAHVAALFSSLGLAESGGLARLNTFAAGDKSELTAGDRGALEEYNRLDQALYDRIARLPQGMLLNPAQLYPKAG